MFFRFFWHFLGNGLVYPRNFLTFNTSTGETIKDIHEIFHDSSIYFPNGGFKVSHLSPCISITTAAQTAEVITWLAPALLARVSRRLIRRRRRTWPMSLCDPIWRFPKPWEYLPKSSKSLDYLRIVLKEDFGDNHFKKPLYDYMRSSLI